ncbi:urea amidolyase family protein [Tersicoccus sp. MR15.9]|uniref:5-oxoprolinase subunit B/C family protein n=1 Tax=Tersicoccus mangrovi TaxID=3121635 RepID=UPI002FE5CC06
MSGTGEQPRQDQAGQDVSPPDLPAQDLPARDRSAQDRSAHGPAGRILPNGDRALLVEVADNAAVLRLRSRLQDARPDGVAELVPAARTLLVIATSPADLGRVSAWVEAALASADDAAGSEATAAGREITVPVHYDGPDLADVAAELGIDADEVIARHTGTTWRVGFMGFAPGFGYLLPGATGGADAPSGSSGASTDGGLTVRRLPTPRTRVRPGSVALADGFSAVYPAASPGGWRLIGRTDHPMWDATAEPPAAVGPGDTVRFVVADDPDASTASIAETATATPDGAGTAARTLAGATSVRPSSPAVRKLTVLQAGPQTLVQDAGRSGRADLGVSPAGALDRHAAAVATALVGNDPGTPVLEVLHGGLQLRAHAELLVAVTGATGPVRINAEPAPQNRAVTIPAGGLLDLGPAVAGMRYYVAFQGGIDATPVLGSASADLLSGLGPASLAAGDELTVGRTRLTLARPSRPLRPRTLPDGDGDVVVRVRPGPRRDWFDDAAWQALMDARWTATGDSNRVGIRLDGPTLTRVRDDELPSEGMVTGSLQVPPSGLPTVFLADHPVTGGYPVIAVVVDADLDVLAQLRPGQGLRFTDGAFRFGAGLQGPVNRVERVIGSLFRR